MRNKITRLISFSFLISAPSLAQTDTVLNAISDTIVAAGPEYKTSSFHQWLWGRNYRADWGTPVRVPVVKLETTYGGLKPVKAGGGNQTKSLQAETAGGSTYTFRTVNKTLGKVLPDEFLNTFIEDIVNDKVSMSHPYGAAAVPLLAERAKIYHTYPRYVWLPGQTALDTFNKVFADRLYLLEQKVDGNWKEADNLGNYENFISTDNLLKKMLKDNEDRVDQKAFVRARLLDMFINDWDRHEDQWEWGGRKTGDQTIYTAVPQDRDQAFFKYNGVLLKFMIGASGLSYFQPFAEDLKDVKTFNYEQRNLDRFFANELTLNDWLSIAGELQQAFTDAVIDSAVRQMPPESFSISGQGIINTLKARRDKLQKWASDYYYFLAKQVDVAASEKKEYFEVKRLDDKQTEVNIYRISKEGERSAAPFYSRTFNTNETREVRLYGISGNDIYKVTGNGDFNLKVRLIGGDEQDSINVVGKKVHVYDNEDNVFQTSRPTRMHLSNDSAIHEFKYKSFLYSKKGIKPIIFYGSDDRLFVGLGYSILTNKWRKEPFASKQIIQANYSISQKAFSVIYNGLFPAAFGKTDLGLTAMYDQIRWTNFFGLGNETKITGDDIDFYRARSEEWLAEAALIRRFGKSTFRLLGNFQRIRVLQDFDRFIGKTTNNNNLIFDPKYFSTGQLSYSVHSLNDSIVPTKGASFFSNASYTQNLKQTNRYVGRFGADARFYIPLFSKFSLGIRGGAETVTGTPEFYQYVSIGGSEQAHAFRRGRFWGKTGVYNSNELRFISDVKSYLYNGKLGLITFYDLARVWMPNEVSNTLHTGYGFGIIVAPFNKIAAEVTYGISDAENIIQFRIAKNF